MDYFDGVLMRANNISIAVMVASVIVSIFTGIATLIYCGDKDMISNFQKMQKAFKFSIVTFAIACGFYILIGI